MLISLNSAATSLSHGRKLPFAVSGIYYRGSLLLKLLKISDCCFGIVPNAQPYMEEKNQRSVLLSPRLSIPVEEGLERI